jgi:hypothetical protein
MKFKSKSDIFNRLSTVLTGYLKKEIFFIFPVKNKFKNNQLENERN